MSFFAELSRRQVVKVAIAYAIVAWLLVQVASVLVPALRMPDWALSFVVLLLVIGFPVALILAWAYELTPDGVRKTGSVAVSEPVRRDRTRRLDFAIIGLLSAALVFVAVDQYVLEEAGQDPIAASDAREASVAVLPFVSLSANPEQVYFADGISEELLNVLARIPELHVPSRTSSFSFRGTNTPLADVGAELGVAHILEGSVGRDGDQVRVRAQLIDISTNRSLWSDTFDRELIGVFEIQDEIAMRVAEALQLTLLGTPGQGLSRTDNTAAHDAYLRGLAGLASFTSAGVLQAIDDFQLSVELDPQFAAAYSMLARAYNTARSFDFVDAGEAIAGATAAVNRALELDPLLASAYAARAELTRDLSMRLADLQRAAELGLNDAEAWLSRAGALYALDRRAESRRALEEASRLDPRNPMINWQMGALRLNLGDRSGGRGYYTRQIELDPDNPLGYAGLGDAAVFEGRIDEGVRLYREALERDPRHGHMTVWTAFLYLTLGDENRAQLWFDRGANILAGRGTAREFFAEFIPLIRHNADEARLMALLPGVTPEFFGPFQTRIFRKAVLVTRDTDRIRAWYESLWPQLFGAEPVINNFNFDVAPDVAWLLRADGETERANALLERALEMYRGNEWAAIYPADPATYLVEVECLTLLGRPDEALEALRSIFDDGWRFGWWQVETDPVLEPLREAPQFIEVMDSIRADMTAQRGAMPVWDLPVDP